jgi:hypothetical protein
MTRLAALSVIVAGILIAISFAVAIFEDVVCFRPYDMASIVPVGARHAKTLD